MKIKVIFADLGGVLIVNKAKEVGEKYDKSDNLTPEKTKNAFRFIQTAKRTDEELATYLESENIKMDVWKRFLADFYASESRNDDLVELLKKAKSSGIFVVYTTNNSAKLIDLMKKYQIDEVADLIVNSSDANVAKPDPEFWKVALSETKKFIPDVQLDKILVIDDSQKNCVSAEDFGFRSYTYENTSESQTEIDALIY